MSNKWMPFLAAASTVLAVSALGQGVIYSNNFDDDPVGTYTVENLNADWNNRPFDNGIEQGRGTIVTGSEAYSGNALQVLYPEGSVGSSDNTGGGAQWRADLGASYDELYLSYRLRFGEDFDFVRGGKLPGFSGGTANTGGNVPDGTDGWSARLHWRTDGSGGSPTTRDTANVVQYVYHPDQPGTFGQDIRWDDGDDGQWAEFESDRWYTLEQRVVINTPGENDGIIEAWLDGEKVLEVSNLRFRDVDSFAIDQVLFSTFFGGSSDIWAPTKDEYAFYDDFVVSTEPIRAFDPSDALLGDYNDDGFVGQQDLDAVLLNFGDSTLPEGFHEDALAGGGPFDGRIGQDELDTVLLNFGEGAATATANLTAVPEPASVLLLTLLVGGLSLSRGGAATRGG